MATLNKQHPLYQEDLDRIISTKGFSTLHGKSVLVTGATGLIGLQLVDALMKANLQGAEIRIYAVGRSRAKTKERLGEYFGNPLFCFIEQDVTQPFDESLQVDYILPLASFTHPLAYSAYPLETMMVNLKGAEHALTLAKRSGATVMYASTVEIYGNARGEDVFTEEYTGQLNLSTSRACYTEAKRACEALCQSYISEYGVKVMIGRLCRVFGPTVLGDDSKASSQFIRKSLAGEDIVLKSKGDQFFSYIYVSDAVSALLHIMINGENGTAYNISNDKCNVHLRDFAQSCAEASGTKVVFDLPSEAESKGYSVATKAILDNSRLTGLGWHPECDFNNAISRTLKIISENSGDKAEF